MKTNKKINNLCIDNIKINSLALIKKANLNDYGLALSAAKIMHALFAYNLNYNLQDHKWVNRDRLVIANSSFLPTYYAAARLAKLLTKKEEANFENILNTKIDFIDSSLETYQNNLGSAFSNAVGMAIAENILNNKFNEVKHSIYVLCNDFDLLSGEAQEALSLAANLKLKNLIIISNSTEVLRDSLLSTISNENVAAKYKAMKINYQRIANRISKINYAISKAKVSSRPTIIEIKTTIGENMKYENSTLIYENKLTDADINELKEKLTYKKSNNLDVYKECSDFYKTTYKLRLEKTCKAFKMSKKLQTFLFEESKLNLNDIAINSKLSIPALFGTIIENISNKYQNSIFCTANTINITNIKNSNNMYAPNNISGTNLLLGPRTSILGNVANGINLHSNFVAIASDILDNFALFLESFKLARQMNLKTIFLLSNINELNKNDNIQELRALSNNLYMPLSLNEIKTTIENIFNETANKLPSIIVINEAKNQELLSLIDEKHENNSMYYLIKKIPMTYSLISSSLNIEMAYEIALKLKLSLIYATNLKNIDLNYDKNKTISIENTNFEQWTNLAKYNIGNNNLNTFATSKQKPELINFNVEEITKIVEKLIK